MVKAPSGLTVCLFEVWHFSPVPSSHPMPGTLNVLSNCCICGWKWCTKLYLLSTEAKPGTVLSTSYG